MRFTLRDVLYFYGYSKEEQQIDLAKLGAVRGCFDEKYKAEKSSEISDEEAGTLLDSTDFGTMSEGSNWWVAITQAKFIQEEAIVFFIRQKEKLKQCEIFEYITDLPLSINQSDKTFRKGKTKEAQEAIAKIPNLDLSPDELHLINKLLNAQNYCLLKAGDTWLLLDRENSFEKTYKERFNYFLKNTNDKEQCFGALSTFFSELCSLDGVMKWLDKGVILHDIGAGDGRLGTKLATVLNKRGKAHYIAVERDPKFEPQIQEAIKKANISAIVYPQDFKDIQNALAQEEAHIILASHLYTSTKPAEFLPMMLKKENSIIVMVHDTANSDAASFRKHIGALLKIGTNDCTVGIEGAMKSLELDSMTTHYTSTLSLPHRLTNEDWEVLHQIQQGNYAASYTSYSPELSVMKHLLEFVIGDKLEAFSNDERKFILIELRKYLEEKDYKLQSTCKIQVALSAKYTKEFQHEFLQLKAKIEQPAMQSSKQQENTKALHALSLFKLDKLIKELKEDCPALESEGHDLSMSN